MVLLPKELDPISPESLAEHAKAKVLDAEFSDHNLSDLLRLAAAFEEVSVSYESAAKRYTVVLPKELERLGLIPEIGSSVVILAVGETLELWKPSAWTHFRASHASRTPQLLMDLNDLG